LSHTALAGIIGGAGAGAAGVLIASRQPSDTSSNPPPGGPSSTVTPRTFSGSFNGEVVMTTMTTTQSGISTCVSVRSIVGTMTIQLVQRADGTVTGTGSTNGTQTETAVTQSPLCPAAGTLTNSGPIPFDNGGPLTGTAANIAFDRQTTNTGSSGTVTLTVTTTFAFTGALSNGVIAGTVTYSLVGDGQQNPPLNGTIINRGSTTFAVTLR
jgi:hypothetical protein